jgi:hypothetical protein
MSVLPQMTASWFIIWLTWYGLIQQPLCEGTLDKIKIYQDIVIESPDDTMRPPMQVCKIKQRWYWGYWHMSRLEHWLPRIPHQNGMICFQFWDPFFSSPVDVCKPAGFFHLHGHLTKFTNTFGCIYHIHVNTIWVWVIGEPPYIWWGIPWFPVEFPTTNPVNGSRILIRFRPSKEVTFIKPDQNSATLLQKKSSYSSRPNIIKLKERRFLEIWTWGNSGTPISNPYQTQF